MAIFRLPLENLILTVVGCIAIAYILLCLLALLWQNRLIFFPSPVIETTPADLGLVYEEVWLPVQTKTGKVENLNGWWIPTTSSEARILLYLHGNGQNIGANVEYAQRFQQLGFSVLMIDYRGYGRSEGKFPTEDQVYQDAQAAWDYLVQQRGIPPQEIFVYGHSLGGAVAIDLAVSNSTMAGLIVEGSFTSIRDMADDRGNYGFLPLELILTQRFDSISKIKSLSIPLLLIHGTSDQIVPAAMSEVLFDAAHVPKQLLLVPGAGHNDVAMVAGDQYRQKIQQFVEQVRLIRNC